MADPNPLSETEPLSAESLELLKLRGEILGAQRLKEAEIEKTLAEAQKARADALGAHLSFHDLWKRPTSWAAILPGLAALLTAGYGAYNGYFAAYFDTQKESLNAKVEVLKAETTKLEARKELLEGQLELKQERLKDESARLEARRLEFEGQRKDYDRQIADLKAESLRLMVERKRLVVQLPLDNLLGDEQKAESTFNEHYTAIFNAIKNDRDADNRLANVALVASHVEKVKSPVVKAFLYRTLYLATEKPEFLENLKSFVLEQGTKVERIEQVFYRNTPWPKDARGQLFKTVVSKLSLAVAEKSTNSLLIAEALLNLCGWRCTDIDDVAVKHQAANTVRDAIAVADGRPFYDQQPAHTLIYATNELAGRLLFARLWRDDKSGQISESHAGGFFGDIAGTAGQASNRPKSNDKAEWLLWLEQNQAVLEQVLKDPADKWPTALASN